MDVRQAMQIKFVRPLKNRNAVEQYDSKNSIKEITMENDKWAKLVPELSVNNILDTLRFYVDTLGFIVKYGRPEDGFAYLDKEGAQIMVEEIRDGGRSWKTGFLENPYGRGINFQIEIADVDKLYNKLKTIDYPIFMDIEEKWYRTGNTMGGNKQFLVQDPDGYLLRFFTHMGNKKLDEN